MTGAFLLAALTKILKQSDFVVMGAVIGNISINALIAAWPPRGLFFGQSMPGVTEACCGWRWRG